MIQKQEKIHTRKIDIATYKGSEDTIVVEGSLKDERLFASFLATGEKGPPGIFHHLIIRMEVKGPELVIQDIEVEMPRVPNEYCIEIIDCLAPIKGLPIVSGFTRKAKAIAGGPRGCNHLLALLIAMAPAAVQGAFSLISLKPIDKGSRDKIRSERLKNTCYAWREDGPLLERYKELVK